MEGTNRIEAGEIENLETSVSRFEWKIPRIKSILRQEDDYCESPPYYFCDAMWTFKITRRRHLIICHISRYVKKYNHKNYLDWKLLTIKSDGSDFLLGEENYTADESIWRTFYIYDSIKFKWDDQEEQSDMKIRCFLRCFDCGASYHTKDGSCLKVYSETLSHQLKDFFLGCKEGDVIIKVQEKEFAAHRMILQARSPVLFATFSHDMLEKKTGVLNVTDIEPHIFYNVLLYLYTGEVKGLHSDTFCQIFAFAHKYDLAELRNECIRFVYGNLNEEILYDVLQLAHLYNEPKVKELAEQFISKKRKEVFPSYEWKTFKIQNPALALEILESILTTDST